MILGDINPKEGGTKRPLRWIVAALALLVLAAFGFARCQPPAPPVPPAPIAATPTPTAQAIASSSTAATLTNDLEIIVPPRRVAQNPYTAVQTRPVEAQTKQPRGEVVDEFSQGSYSAVQDEPIIIRIKQTATAAASSEASASDSPMSPWHSPMAQEHARLGAFVGIVPGAIALTYQVACFQIPAEVLGTRLGIGLEVEGNAQQLGAGISVGGKAFATGGGYLGWAGPGWYMGVGMRF